MANMQTWWMARSQSERAWATLACLALIFFAGTDIGRSLYQATH